MPDFAQLSSEEVLATCGKNAGPIAAALGRALGAELTFSPGQAESFQLEKLKSPLAGPGLVTVFSLEGVGVVLLVPETSGLASKWCAAPDAAGQSRLAALGQELGTLLLPDAYMPDDSRMFWVSSAVDALRKASVAEGELCLSLKFKSGEGAESEAWLVWPAASPNQVQGTIVAEPPVPAGAPSKPAVSPRAASDSQTLPSRQALGEKSSPSPAALPPYSRSLLRIRVPVVVSLAQNRQPLGRVIELGPGSILHFDKSCDEPLDLEVGNTPIARGEAVKVGDKFGLRITSIVLPDERFLPIRTLTK